MSGVSSAANRPPCPLCRKAEHLVTYPWQNLECVIQVVECCVCTVIAPADTWDKLPRTEQRS